MIKPAYWLAVALTIVTGMSACTQNQRAEHILWQISGETNTVYLLGSVHLLRKEDYPLPAIYDAVYAEAESIIMELDMDDLDPMHIQQHMMTTGMVEEGNSLQLILGDTVWEEASALADTLEIRLDMLNATEPWLAALTIVELQMAKLGFDSSLGVETYFLNQALKDKKPIQGLETIEEQIDIFDRLPLEEQSRFLLKTLQDAQSIEAGLDELIAAWRSGDLATMHDELIKGFEGFPGVYESLVAQRNRAWTRDIEELLDDQDDYLIIVGALHLIGKDSVIRQLSKMGYDISQL